jgi:hypothetical protein
MWSQVVVPLKRLILLAIPLNGNEYCHCVAMHPSTYASIFVLELIDFFWQIYRRKMS